MSAMGCACWGGVLFPKRTCDKEASKQRTLQVSQHSLRTLDQEGIPQSLYGQVRANRPVSTRPRRPCPLLLSCKVQFQRTNGLKPSLPPSAAVTPARETDHGLPGLAVKKRNGRKLAWGSLLFDSHIRATNAPALHLVNPKNPAILSRKKIETGARRRGRPTKIRGDSSYSRGPCIYFGQTLISCLPAFSPPKGPAPGFAGSRGLPK